MREVRPIGARIGCKREGATQGISEVRQGMTASRLLRQTVDYLLGLHPVRLFLGLMLAAVLLSEIVAPLIFWGIYGLTGTAYLAAPPMTAVIVATPLIYVIVAAIGRLRSLNEQLYETTLDLRRESRALTRVAEEAERQRQAAAKANEAKSRFLSAMSHELRTPLNAILGFSEVIRDRKLGEGQSERYASYAADIHAAGRNLLELVNQVLELSRIEAGQIRIDPTAISVEELLEECLEVVAEQVEEKQLHIETSSVSRDLIVHADGYALREALLQIVRNAISFTESGGRIEVTAAAAVGGGVRIEVADNGVGILPEDLKRIREPFEQAEREPFTSLDGNGLGLSIAEGLVHLHEGRLAIDSTPGEGTRVSVYIPEFEGKATAA